MTKAEAVLMDYFLENHESQISSAGCNDMPQDVFTKLEPWRLNNLLTEFRRWDKVANPHGYKPRQLATIPDFAWVGFLRSRLGLEVK